MSSVEIPSDDDLVAIRYIDAVQEIGRIAVDYHNKQTGENLKFKCVVNGLRSLNETLFVLVVEAKTADEINWTYKTGVFVYPSIPNPTYVPKYFEPVLKYKK